MCLMHPISSWDIRELLPRANNLFWCGGTHTHAPSTWRHTATVDIERVDPEANSAFVVNVLSVPFLSTFVTETFIWVEMHILELRWRRQWERCWWRQRPTTFRTAHYSLCELGKFSGQPFSRHRSSSFVYTLHNRRNHFLHFLFQSFTNIKRCFHRRKLNLKWYQIEMNKPKTAPQRTIGLFCSIFTFFVRFQRRAA